ncbi:FtsK domain-containing protein [Frankia sp. AiPs1]|uniref:FtsK/SpoIIIE domain-containing protein n=1 Tax=Frankia sp. AiPa1 TaxID=573492 RepID=UPI00202B0046|nr:FtsK/SpoIIIE domain-containing protein [Frankia sp. AiPa1]MCL9758035.1 FtsK/SpoIIIE domain-containing protein [Frankia sp. AiPa1]
MDEPAPLIDRLHRLRSLIDQAQREATKAVQAADTQLAAQRKKISEARGEAQRDNVAWRAANVRPLLAQVQEALGPRTHLWDQAQRERAGSRHGAATVDSLELAAAVDLLALAARRLHSIWRRKRYWTTAAAAAARQADRQIAQADADAERQAQQAIARAVDDHHQAVTAVRQRWQARFTRLQPVLANTITELDRIDRSAEADWTDWAPPHEPLGAIRVGRYTRRGFGGEPVTVPALFPFPATTNLVIKAVRENPDHADTVLGLICRMFAALPPGQLRLSVIDPLTLGRSVRSLAGLNSDDVQLMDDPLDETIDIERRLADLVRRIRRVDRDLLGPHRLGSLVEYNRQVAARPEPHHVVVLFDFPTGFRSTDSRTRIDQVMSNGPSCGVHTVLVVNADDPDHPHHLEFTADGQVRPGPASFTSTSTSTAADVGDWSIELGHPREGRWEPSKALRTVIDRVADEARDAGLVVVSVERMFALMAQQAQPPTSGRAPGVAGAADIGGIPGAKAPISPGEPDSWWQGDASGGLVVPIGIYGLDDVQALRLGEGTRQHAMIAGTTGSGKSTLLHTLIMSAATVYSPEELELYLVDLKGGVEFQEYAVRSLPHARVVSVHSERDFGLETMQDLLAQSRYRERLFTRYGVQDLPGYRRARAAALPGDPLLAEPHLARILLVVDEYHVLFDGDDLSARTAAQCLNRLVRQGRAFGIGVLMASQTPSSTIHLGTDVIGQIDVRIALRCPEHISRRILAENNPAAARLGSRGEAIYNPNAGEPEANTTFQVAYQEREVRADTLDRMSRLARSRGFTRVPAVYDGDRPGDITREDAFSAHTLAARATAAALATATSAPRSSRRSTSTPAPPSTSNSMSPPAPSGPLRVWLGEPTGLSGPVGLDFDPRPRRALLVVGDDEANVGVLTSVIASLAAAGLGRPTTTAATAATSGAVTAAGAAPTSDAVTAAGAVSVIDFTGPGSHYTSVHAELAVLLPGLHRCGAGEALAHVSALADEVRSRVDGNSQANLAANAHFLLINGLHRCPGGLRDSPRGFRPAGFGVPLDVLLAQGPDVGIFVIATIDPGAQRHVHGEILNEFGPVLTRWQPQSFDHRIQTLIGRPTASLREGQALLIDDDTERRLRPYRIPPPGWLTDLANHLPRPDQRLS